MIFCEMMRVYILEGFVLAREIIFFLENYWIHYQRCLENVMYQLCRVKRKLDFFANVKLPTGQMRGDDAADLYIWLRYKNSLTL